MPFGLNVEATEKQNAQDHDDGDYNYLDQGHGKFLKVAGQERNDAAKNKPYSRKRLSELSNSSRRFRSQMTISTANYLSPIRPPLKGSSVYLNLRLKRPLNRRGKPT